MTIRDLIDRLTKIAAEHGDNLPVLHHDDWNEFVVDTVDYMPESRENPAIGDWHDPAHVLLSGVDVVIDGKGGLKSVKER